MANDPHYSQVIMSNLAEINQRIENADAYFQHFPNSLSDAKITGAYSELRLRQEYLQKAKKFLDYLQDNRTNTCDAPKNCLQFYSYTIAPFMYNTEETKKNYKDAVEVLLKVFPDWDKRLSYRAGNIRKSIEGTSTRQYHYALKAYMEICVELFLWIRQKTYPLKEAKPS